MYSMTGFGKAEVSSKVGKITVEISTVNNRFLEISTRLPRNFFNLEQKIRELVSAHLNRGKVNVFVCFEEPVVTSSKYTINIEAAESLYKQLVKLQKKLGSKEAVSIRDLLAFPDVTRAENGVIDEEQVWVVLEKALAKGIKDLVEMRKKEGGAMANDMKQRLALLKKHVSEVQKQSPLAVSAYREKLSKRLEEIMPAKFTEGNRIEEEIALMAERSDVTEECTRFLSHLEQYRASLSDKQPVGKKLNFILQELNREANTIASKCSEINIASTVIAIKEEVEKLRELVQNVE